MPGKNIVVGGVEIRAGKTDTVDLPIANLYTHTSLNMPVHVVNGRHDGPTMFITSALHGDELNGVEIIKRLLKRVTPKKLRGCVLAIPIVNVFGFLNQSRYLPDRRDLNRSFPGRETGSIAARIANLVSTEIIGQSDFGIDLHTAAVNRTNLPQIRANLSDPVVRKMADAFGAPVAIDAAVRDGTLRQYASREGKPTLLYECGEALRFDELSIKAGVRGILRVLRVLEMLPAAPPEKIVVEPTYANSTTWVRAPISGLVTAKCRLGQRVKSGQTLARINDPFGEIEVDVPASVPGIVIGRSTSPLTHEGDALVHLARFDDSQEAKATVDDFYEAHGQDTNWG
ncbi:MAG: succinylglutamate desuccinylase/aspartoacylase family protein [Gammaproteobacteria bacterium]|nr:succinylglutamate desuccinylase/aspartoacylase family protein [Gammaproteobacteria bacterium]MDH5213111.1 succinylglutamate desuccinylase/aspartoacylase family protein [Gammaproteobacteria bacterium]